MTKHHFSRLLGAVLLIAGTATGAGILALPMACAEAGFFPSIIVMFFCWLYLLYSAFCILEVNLAVEHQGNLVSMASKTLGRFGKYVSWTAYLFLLYALNTAYIAALIDTCQQILAGFFGASVAKMFCATPLFLIFAVLMRQRVKMVDEINRVFMTLILLSFTFLNMMSLPHIEPSHFLTANRAYFFSAISTIVTAFGFHVIIPTLTNYLHGNVKALKKAIWIGSSIPLVGYIIWQVAIFGISPQEGVLSLKAFHTAGKNGADLIFALSKNTSVKIAAEVFAFSVIMTSFLGVSISLFDFLKDGLHAVGRSQKKWKLFFFTFVPPLYFALVYPLAFFQALEYAGAFGVVILLALLPAGMVWSKRYWLKIKTPFEVKGGKVTLILFMLLSLSIIAIEIAKKVSLIH